MRLLIISFLTVTLSSLSLPGFGNNMKINPEVSQLKWEGSKVVGGSHQGTVAIKSGNIVFKGSTPQSAKLVVDMKSIVNEDLKDAEWNKKLVTHLNSDDFFSVAKFPTATVSIESFKELGPREYQLNGKLTIKGITKPVSLKAKMTGTPQSWDGLSADMVFDRTDFDVRYGSGKFFENLGDKMIADEVKISVKLGFSTPVQITQK